MKFMYIGQNNRIDRTRLFTEATVDTLKQINIVSRRPSSTVLSFFRLDGDGHCRANRFAKFASNAAFLSVRIPSKRMQAPKPG
jgi:hypothetical protein